MDPRGATFRPVRSGARDATIRAVIARHLLASGRDAAHVAGELAAGLNAPGDAPLALVFAFADWRLDPASFARELQRGCATAPVVGCSTIGPIGASGPAEAPAAAALGLYGDWLRAGIGLAGDLTSSPLVRSRDAVGLAAAALGTTPGALDPMRHVMVTLVDGCCGGEEAFCIGSAATAPQIRFVGGAAASEPGGTRPAYVWARGEALPDAGVAVLLESQLPFAVVSSTHLVPTDARTVVTAASGRIIEQLDGRPAAERLRELVAGLGGTLDEARPARFQLARFIDGVPYVRAMTRIDGTRVHLAGAVEPGHVLRVMRPGDLIGRTRRDLAATAELLGGDLAALLAFSCIGRHWEAATSGLERELAEVHAAYPTTGCQTAGEQTGMLLVNCTLTGLAIGGAKP